MATIWQILSLCSYDSWPDFVHEASLQQGTLHENAQNTAQHDTTVHQQQRNTQGTHTSERPSLVKHLIRAVYNQDIEEVRSLLHTITGDQSDNNNNDKEPEGVHKRQRISKDKRGGETNDNNDCDIDKLANKQINALHAAVMKENVEIAKLLLQNHANPDIFKVNGYGYGQDGDYKEQITPLGIAIRLHRRDVAALLLAHGASPNKQMILTGEPYTLVVEDMPLCMAIREQDVAMVDLLLRHGANPFSATVQRSSTDETAAPDRVWTAAEQLFDQFFGYQLTKEVPSETDAVQRKQQIIRKLMEYARQAPIMLSATSATQD